jgi:putative transposase
MLPSRRIPQDAILGVDVGLTHVAIESDGRKTDNPKFVGRAQRNLRKQRALSRKQKGLRNRAKARLIVAAHERVSNARGDFQHQLSRRLVEENQAIIVETLVVKNIICSRTANLRGLSQMRAGTACC